MWKTKQNRAFFCGVAIFLFLLGAMIGFLGNGLFQSCKSGEDDVEERVFISTEMQRSIEQLETFVDLAITRYCDEKGVENLYTFELFEDMLHYNTCIYDVEKRYTYDLNKTISSNLANHRFLIKVEGINDIIYVEVNTYRMKLYVYEEEHIGRIVKGESADPLLDKINIDEYVECDWPEDMWTGEYSEFVLEGWKYLKTPNVDEMINHDLYGMVIYSLRRYCEEKGIQEMFYFDFPNDKISNVTARIFTVKVTSNKRILYIDIDMDRNKVHIYQVE